MFQSIILYYSHTKNNIDNPLHPPLIKGVASVSKGVIILVMCDNSLCFSVQVQIGGEFKEINYGLHYIMYSQTLVGVRVLM
jgi:hypothetical protein